MSDEITHRTPPAFPTGQGAVAGTAGGDPAGERSGIPWERYLAALKRRRALVAGTVLGALALGAVATRLFRPTYEVHSTVWLSLGAAPRPEGAREERLAAPAWGEVVRSFTVLDPVADQLSLFVTPAKAADSLVVAGFHAAPSIAAGKYALQITPDGRSWTLRDEDDRVVDRGAVGDSVGRTIGFRWAPRQPALGRDRTVKLTVVTPRQAALKLRKRLEVGFPDTSILSVRLTGPQPARDARILNEIDRQFVSEASRLIRGGQSQSAQQLAQQLGQAEAALRRSEEALRSYRTGTVGLPAQDEPGMRDPAFTMLYDQRAALDSIRADRRALERLVDGSGGGTQGIDPSALLAIPAARNAPELTAAIADLTRAQGQLETLRRTYTDEYRVVQDTRAEIDRITRQTLPTLAVAVLDRLRSSERDLQSRVAESNGALRAVPTRTIDQQRLQRDVQVNASLYSALRSQYDAARLSEVGAVPGIAVLDSAVAPTDPVTNTRPGILLAALLAGVGLAVAVALLLDATDTRLWYPEHVEALGFEIAGAIPRAPDAVHEMDDPVGAARLQESVRALRLHLLNAAPSGRPLTLSVLSVEAGDGKSFVAARLARSFAQSGHRTVLVDGDIRRGTIDHAFHVTRTPGLTDHLAGRAPLDTVTYATEQPGLSVIPGGARMHEGPELLSSAKLRALVAELGARYEVVVVDTPPLGAGADACCLATATGEAVLVMRAEKTDRRRARGQLAKIRRLPVRFLGVVLNAIRPEGAFASYAFLPEYAVYAPRPHAEAERPLPVSREEDGVSADASRPARSTPAARPPNHW